MGKRRDPRVPVKLQVRIAGVDAQGRPLLGMVTTRDISRSGALVEGLQGTFKPGEIVSVSYKNNKGRFRVAWMGEPGTARASQMGIQSLDPARCVWDVALLPPPGADSYVVQPKENRQHRRVQCKLGAELRMQGSEALVRAHVTNISLGGCFVEMSTLPPDKSRLKITIWVNENKLAIQGVVVSRRPGFGISIKFTEMADDVREHLQRYIQPRLVPRDR
ncbi:MAG: PilZ domain-containing protein [Terriglobales bacterium]|jgi:hypothetical protein|nr:PilZ domain-containing protein [Terriglobales bacterium]